MLRRAELGGRRDDEQTIVGEVLRYSLGASLLAQKRIIENASRVQPSSSRLGEK